MQGSNWKSTSTAIEWRPPRVAVTLLVGAALLQIALPIEVHPPALLSGGLVAI